VGDGDSVNLEAGDRLELPARTDHDALVGPEGVTCLEAHLPPGSLTEGVRVILGRSREAGATSRDP
jgi:hypothetical protein